MDTERYARINSSTGKGMYEGYCFNEGDFYCETEEQAKSYVESLGLNWEKELLTIDTDDEWFYWTNWIETAEYVYYDYNGNIIK